MPVIIDEVIAEIDEPISPPAEHTAAGLQQPLTQTEMEMIVTLERIKQRQQRLIVD